MAVKSRRPAGRAKSRAKTPRRRAWGFLLVVGLLLFAGGVYFGGRLQHKLHLPTVAGASRPLGTARSAMPTARHRTVSESAAGDATPLPPTAGHPSRVALVIDDLGRSVAEVRQLRELGVVLTYSVLPFESVTPKVVEELHRLEVEVLCHLPMEAESSADPGPGALRLGMSDAQLVALTRSALEAVPGAVGVNNHMGSALSADARSMRAILSAIAEKGLFYLDSRTNPESVGYREAERLGIPAAERQVFLDADPSPAAIAEEFRRMLQIASDKGVVIAIAHPHPATLEVLARELRRAKAAGYEFVPVSYLVDRRVAAPD